MIKKIIPFILLLALASSGFSQKLKNSRSTSYYTYIFRLNEKEAARIVEKNKLRTQKKYFTYAGDVVKTLPDYLESRVDSFPTDSMYAYKPAPGYYLYASVSGTLVNFDFHAEYTINTQIIPHNRDLIVAVYTKDNAPVTDAKICIDSKAVPYDATIKAYRLKDFHKKGMLQVKSGSENAFYNLENYTYRPRKGLRLAGRIVLYPLKVVYGVVFCPVYTFNYIFKRSARQYSYFGYIATNKPKYLPKDTVKIKAYVVNKKGKPSGKTFYLNVYGYDKSYNYVKVVNKELKPTGKGAYTSEFVLGDSLTLNMNYYVNLAFNNKRWPTTLSNVSNTFYLEDYQLDETEYQLTTDKDNYSKGDNIVVSASGNDANGFPLKDSKVKITAEVKWVDDFGAKKLFVPLKLWEDEEELLPTGITKIIIPDSIFPEDASLSVTITALFNNSNNESREIVKLISIGSQRQSLDVTVVNDSLVVKSEGNDESNVAAASVRAFSNADTTQSQSMILPGKIKIDAMADGYEVKLGALRKTIKLANEASLVEATNTRTADSIKIDLLNPRKLTIMYIIYNGEKEIESGNVSGDFHWKRKDLSKSSYFIKYRYMWAGTLDELNYAAHVEEQKLKVEVKQPETIFPGQQTDVKVNVSDYKGQPVKDVNLTALAINTQFDRSNIPSVPYLDKSKKGLKGNNSFYLSTPYPDERYTLNNAWRKKAGLDTIAYYQVRYPAKGICFFYDEILSNNAQFAPFIVKNGYTVNIKMIYLDDTLIYYSPADNMVRYSFVGRPGPHKLRIRTWDHEYTIDNVILKKNFKLDLSISPDTLSPMVQAVKMPHKLTEQEVTMLDNCLVHYNSREAGQTWFWQGDRIYFYNRYYTETFIGPFDTTKTINYYINDRTGNVNMKHGYEMKYVYDDKEIKLQKYQNNIKRIKLKWFSGQYISFGDTAVTMAEIYRKPKSYYVPYSKLMPLDTGNQKGMGTLLFKFNSDSIISTVWLKKSDGTITGDYYGYCRIFYGLSPGVYKIYLTTSSGFSFCKSNVTIVADGVNCIEFSGDEAISNENIPVYILKTKNKQLKNIGVIHGYVTDYESGDPVPYATVILSRGYYGEQTYTTTDMYGHYSLALSDKSYSYMNVYKYGYSGGYEYLYNEGTDIVKNFIIYKISLDKSKAHMNFAAADLDHYTYSNYWTRYSYYSPRLNLYRLHIYHRSYSSAYSFRGPSKRKERFIGGEEDERYVRMEDKNADVSKSAGVIRGGNWMGSVNGLAEVTVKGSLGISGGRFLVPKEDHYDENTQPITSTVKAGMMDTASINALLRQNAGNMFKNVRSHFSDYGYWNNNMFTDANGQANFTVKFPDNITQWASYVLAMDGNKHSGTGFVKTKAYNTINASLSMPRFLLPGDTAYVTGKSINIGKYSINIQTAFKLNDVVVKSKNSLLVSSIIDNIPISTKNEDSLSVQFSLLTTDGYSDGEKRMIPVFPVGVNESYGKFFILEKDTTLQVKMNPDSGKVEVFADGNYLNFLLHDIEHLAEYPYYCMEQTASKLSALLMKKNIYTVLDKKFHDEGEIHKLIKKLEKGQSDDGSFGWWPNTKANIWMTSYILNTLYKAQQNGYESKALAKGTAFLEKWIGLISIKETNYTTLEALNVLSGMKSPIDYSKYINRLKYTDLDLTHKFMVIKIQQENKLTYDMNELLKEKKETMLGGMYWGADKQSLYDNSIQASILAYKIFSKDSIYKKYLPNIRNYFFEKKYHGRWQNTVEAASILETILPDILKEIPGKISPSSVTINGKTIKDFPYKSAITDSIVNVSKKGTSPVFITLYQTIWSKDEKSVSKDFTVTTYFESDHEKKTTLTAGQPILLVADIELKKTAEYVMIEIPIPAGCSYGENDGKENSVEVHREYLKNKTNVFCENLKPGKYRFVIELQPRYTGSYTLNPAKAELMYFPTFFGREGIKRMRIK